MASAAAWATARPALAPLPRPSWTGCRRTSPLWVRGGVEGRSGVLLRRMGCGRVLRRALSVRASGPPRGCQQLVAVATVLWLFLRAVYARESLSLLVDCRV